MIKINNEKYLLDSTQYYQKETKKRRIVIGHSLSDDMSFFDGWLKKYNGKFKRTAMFTIDKDGKIYQHFDPTYYSKFLNITDIDEETISINLVNSGWVNSQNDDFYDCYNNKVKPSKVIYKEWREHRFWVSYSPKQFNSLINLCEYLSNKYGIKLKTTGHNVKIDNIYNFDGITFRSNYRSEYYDLSPAFEFEKFDNEIIKLNKN